jgi:demethylmenaquinone methyltransferase/2-methoxy-6-polyprenyl-1,4-benzoquinol methylase
MNGNIPRYNEGKAQDQIGNMFDSIAWRYDFLNHFLSFGIDRLWRRKAIKLIPGECENTEILDVATGTADLAIEAAKLNPSKVTGIDISDRMLEIGRKKVNDKNLSGKIELLSGSSENIPFKNNSFDIAMVAFGVRNFSDLPKGLGEMHRVLREGGRIMILEFSKPAGFPFRQAYDFYFRNILPVLGRIFSGNRKAYRYLPESVMKFHDNEEFADIMQLAGFNGIRMVRLTYGVVTVFTGIKLPEQ